MATVNDVSKAQITGAVSIDALLDDGPAWNYLTPGTNSVITYTFTVGVNDEVGNTSITGTPVAFNATQQASTRSMLSYISSVTGITFSETGGGAPAKLHFANIDIVGASTSGLCSWGSSYTYNNEVDKVIVTYNANAYVYLDNREWNANNSVAQPGNQGYETLLHEMGHALGLKHSFDGPVRLPTAVDNTSNTVMSYTDKGGPYSTFRPYDLMALDWLYGGDGLAGAAGRNSTGGARNFFGSAGNDVAAGTNANDSFNGVAGSDIFAGLAGNDTIDGGAGTDTAMFGAARNNFTIQKSGNTLFVVDNTGVLGTDTVTNVERLQFDDKVIAFDVDGNAGKAYRLYQAAFDRVPDQGGLAYWVSVLDQGNSLSAAANGFATSAEFIALYGQNASAQTVVNLLYNHVLHRAGEAAGVAYWVGVLQQGIAVADVLASFSESPENQAQLIGVIQNGMEYTVI